MIAIAGSTRQRAGSGALHVELVDGRTSAVAVEARYPVKLLVPRGRGPSVWAYVSNFGGGLLPGDAIEISLEVGAGASCFVGTQSSTRIYRAAEQGRVTNDLAARVGPGATLVYAPDVAQSFAKSRFRQRQSFELHGPSSRLAFLDWYSSGRAARDERWQFSEYGSRTEMRVGGRLVFLDSLRLEQGLAGLAASMGRINCVATLVVLGGEAPAIDETFVRRPEVLAVKSAIPGGSVLRVAGTSVELVARVIYSSLAFVADWLGDNPFPRKW